MLEPRTALGMTAPHSVQIGAFTITERTDTAMASLALRRGQDKEFVRAASALGVPLPGPAATVTGDPWSAFWITPEMWMIEAPEASHEDITSHLRTGFGEAASITEQTGAWVRFDISAADLSPLMERLTNLDLPQKPEGFAARTVIDHLGVYLIKRANGRITLYGPRASAKSLLHALEFAAQSLGQVASG